MNTERPSVDEVETFRVDDYSIDKKDLDAIGITIAFHPDIERVGEIAHFVDSGKSRIALSSGRSCLLGRDHLEFVKPCEFAESNFKNARSLDTHFISRNPINIEAPSKESGLKIHCDREDDVEVNGDKVENDCSISTELLRDGIVLVMGKVVALFIQIQPIKFKYVENDLGMIGDNHRVHCLRDEILKVADLNKKVLLRGESGVGKELAARAIFDNSNRRDQPFEIVNITSIQPTLAERELFGADPGSSTSEKGHKGFFLEADKGTLFLDEIGDVDIKIQNCLLRAVQGGGEIRLVGGSKKKVDVRLIAATDADLEQAIDLGTFKQPLLQRFDEYSIFIPPLRERRDDIGRLFVQFLNEELSKLGDGSKLSVPQKKRPWFPASLMASLILYDWPGNVRQLRNVATRIAITNRGPGDFILDDVLGRTLSFDTLSNTNDIETAIRTPNRQLTKYELAAMTDEEI